MPLTIFPALLNAREVDVACPRGRSGPRARAGPSCPGRVPESAEPSDLGELAGSFKRICSGEAYPTADGLRNLDTDTELEDAPVCKQM